MIPDLRSGNPMEAFGYYVARNGNHLTLPNAHFSC